ncbi:hypothetical protein SCHIN_v1c11560 [Spiroplasma chinense]|uniref:Lipoprotein n=1 Tax=Spiroplasma chinense TaxID=216932 RepID=A0A5B9Y6M6_9MOLU|nr:lipoprotein [Spiroplasma chinense]QEH62349.1 hypothetical protein SCHIN_v1c11560 [Spiroplasma chinense]
MRKLLRLIGSLTVVASTAATTVSCQDTFYNRNFYNSGKIRIGHTGLEAKIILWQDQTAISAHFAFSALEFFLEVNEERVELKDDYIIKANDVIIMTPKDKELRKYEDLRIVVSEKRTKIGNIRLTYKKLYSVEKILEIAIERLNRSYPSSYIKEDFEIFINNKNILDLNGKDFVKEGDTVKIEAVPTSTRLVGSYETKVILGVEDLKDFKATIFKNQTHQGIAEELNFLFPGWEDNIDITVKRNGTLVEFNEEYESVEGDIISFDAKPNSNLYKGSLQRNVLGMDTTFVNYSTFKINAGQTVGEAKKMIVETFNSYFKNNNYNITFKTSDIVIRYYADETGFEDDYTVKANDGLFAFINNEYTNGKNLEQRLYIQRIDLPFKNYVLYWYDYETFMKQFEELIHADFPFFDITKELEFLNEEGRRLLEPTDFTNLSGKTIYFDSAYGAEFLAYNVKQSKITFI